MRLRSMLVTILAAFVAWFVVASVPHFAAAAGSARVDRSHETVGAPVASTRIVESARAIAAPAPLPPKVAPAPLERSRIAVAAEPRPPELPRPFSMVFLI